MDSSKEKRLIEILVEEGVVSAQAARHIEEETWVSRPGITDDEVRWGAVLSKFIQHGLIREESLEPLLKRLGQEGFSVERLPDDFLHPAAAEGMVPPPAGTAPIEDWTRYQILSFLGDGGMGQVFKAFDPRLKRFVAVKFVRGNDPALRSRLLQEAQAQARVNHENVCKIYEVGEERGHPFIAMQLIEGKTLYDARAEMSTEQKAVVVKQAAEAVHEAHRLGLIHRDLKPGNIMVERTENGNWRPYVLDFGLAREVEAPGVTATGTILGTPAYLSPEQARGGTLDRRCDVYALGATFYDILVGHPPFQGGAVDVLLKLATEEPVPPRKIDPSIPADLETVVMKCLEKEPYRRYESARALAEDLGRYLDGEPIQARRASLAYRLAKRVRKNKLAVALAAAGLLAATLFGGWALQVRREAAARARLAQAFGQEVERVVGLLERSRLLPLHDTRPEKALVRAKMEWIDAEMKKVGPVSFGPGHYARGCAHMSLGEFAKAKEDLDEAWSQYRYQSPEVAHARGLVLARLYQQELDDAERIGNKDRREAKLREIEKTTRDPAARYLRKGEAVGAGTGLLAEALLAFLDRDYDAAIKKLDEVSAKAPWDYDAEATEASIYVLRGQEAMNAGRYEEAARQYAEAERTFSRALDKGRSDERLYETVGRLHESQMVLQVYGTGRSPKALLEKGLKACERALIADPESGVAYQVRANLLSWWAEYQSEHGEDPGQDIRACVEAADKATQVMPSDASAFHTLGTACLSTAEYESSHGQDPRASLTRATASFERALALQPNTVSTTNNLALAYQEKGEYEMSHGRDPRPTLEKAIQGYRKTAELLPDSPIPLNNLGLARMDVGEWELAHGIDPRRALDEAVASLDRALALNPKMPMAWNNRGVACLDKGNYEVAHGIDPTPSWTAGVTSCEKAASIKADYASPFNNLGILYKALAQFDLDQGRHPDSRVASARACLDKALRINPKHTGAMSTQAQVCVVEASRELRGGRSPLALVDRACAAARKALALDPTLAEAWSAVGGAELVAARWAIQRSSAPDAPLARAYGAFESALKTDAEDASAHEALGRVCLMRAEWVAARSGGRAGAEVEKGVREGLQHAEKALAIAPGQADATALEGSLCLVLAKAGPPEERQTRTRQARDFLRSAVEINPFAKAEYGPSLAAAEKLAAANP